MAYTLTLTHEEHSTFGWIADRYECARILFDGMNEDDDIEGTYHVPEHVAWEYMEALPLENNNLGQIVPPCVGGTLADKLVIFLEGIV